MIRLADRSLTPGDVVRRMVEGQENQRGFVCDTTVTCHVQLLGQNRVIRNVDSRHLRPIQYFTKGTWDVYLNSWIGKVEHDEPVEQVTLVLPDGARCCMDYEQLVNFVDVNDNRGPDAFKFCYAAHYPGQQLRGRLEDKEVVITVEEVATQSVMVHWICRGFSQVTELPDMIVPPPEEIKGEDLKKLRKLPYFDACHVRLGDKKLYTLTESDRIQSLPAHSKSSPLHFIMKVPTTTRGKPKGSKRGGRKKSAGATATPPMGPGKCVKGKTRKLNKKGSQPSTSRDPVRPGDQVGDQVAVEVLYTSSHVSVMWQDGTVEKDIPSTDLFPVHKLDELEFFPGGFVVPSDGADKSHTYGVVKSMDHFGRTCMVHWMTPYDEGQGDRPTEDTSVEEVSAYDIMDHPGYRFRLMDVVVRVGGFKGVDDKGVAAGQVKELGCDGRMLIEWVDGTHSHCYPEELFLVTRELSELDSSFETDWGKADNAVQMLNYEIGEIEGSESVCESRRKAEKLLLINQQLDAIQKSLTKTCLVRSPTSRPLNAITLYRDILHAYHMCQWLDRSSSYFKAEEPSILMFFVRGHLKREKTAKLARRVLKKYQLNARQQCDGKTDRPTPMAGDMDAHNEVVAVEMTDDEPVTEAVKDETDDAGQSPDDAVTTDHDAVASDDDVAQSSTLGPLAYEQSCLACRLLTLYIKMAVADLKRLEADASDDAMDTNELVAQDPNHLTTPTTDRDVSVPVEMSDVSCDTDTLSASVPPEDMLNSDEQNSPVRPAQDLELATADGGVAGVDESPTSVVAMPTLETPQTLAEIETCNLRGYMLEESAPDSHKYKYCDQQPTDRKAFFGAVQKEINLLRTSLPEGIFVKGYEDRMDLLSALVIGPAKTPYEDGMFFFDVHLPNEYPNLPPDFHYISYCNDRLNPNLYERGKVCISLLGTWPGQGAEKWTSKSSLLQVLISIQGLILVDEPYYNEPGYERQEGSQRAHEKSGSYNEMAIFKTIQSMTCMLRNPPSIFEVEVMEHVRLCFPRMIRRLEWWMQMSEEDSTNELVVSDNASSTPGDDSIISSPTGTKPEFPLLPVSKGFRLTLRKKLEQFQALLNKMGDDQSPVNAMDT